MGPNLADLSEFFERLTQDEINNVDGVQADGENEDENPEGAKQDQASDGRAENDEEQEKSNPRKKRRKTGKKGATYTGTKKSTSSTPERAVDMEDDLLYKLFTHNDYLDMGFLNQGLLADSAGETAKTYRRRIYALLGDTRLDRADIYLMMAASLVTTSESRFYQALASITSETNCARVSAWIRTNLATLGKTTTTHLASSFPEVAVLAGLQHDIVTCVDRVRQERRKAEETGVGKKPKLEYINVREVVLRSGGFRVSHQLLLPPGLKVAAMATNLVHGAGVVSLKSREARRDTKTGNAPVKADLNILFTGAQDEFWINLTSDRRFRQDRKTS